MKEGADGESETSSYFQGESGTISLNLYVASYLGQLVAVNSLTKHSKTGIVFTKKQHVELKLV